MSAIDQMTSYSLTFSFINYCCIIISAFFVKAYVAGLYSPTSVWIWLETYPATWWHDTNMTQHEIMKTVVHYSFSFGDNNNVFDNTTETIAGRVSMKKYLFIRL